MTRELSRGGQVFYVYNRIEGIYEKAQRLQELVPTARIGRSDTDKSVKCRPAPPRSAGRAVFPQATRRRAARRRRLGGKGEGALEKVMLDFVEGRYDVLCATAIVESGLDIPREHDDHRPREDLFGLAQLYVSSADIASDRLKERVVLLTSSSCRLNALTDEARARIEALGSATRSSGAEFKIASLDLELRGAERSSAASNPATWPASASTSSAR